MAPAFGSAPTAPAFGSTQPGIVTTGPAAAEASAPDLATLLCAASRMGAADPALLAQALNQILAAL
jgi:hypothetical protein